MFERSRDRWMIRILCLQCSRDLDTADKLPLPAIADGLVHLSQCRNQTVCVLVEEMGDELTHCQLLALKINSPVIMIRRQLGLVEGRVSYRWVGECARFQPISFHNGEHCIHIC